VPKQLLMAIIVFVTAWALIHPALTRASHEDFRYKWPWLSDSSAEVTTLPFQSHHATQRAYDFDVGFPSGSTAILSSTEGPLTAITNQPECNPDGSFGNRVQVTAPNDNVLTYAHLGQVSVLSGELVFQGDNVGVEGRTGNSINPISLKCVAHLHWEFSSFMPAKIDGIDPGTLIVGSRPTSTNVIIGDESIDATAGFQVATEYFQYGQWTNIGYVSNAGRGLAMHRYGSGWEQNFTNHDGQSGIYVPDRVSSDAYWVQHEFWDTYETGTGGATGWLQYPAGEQVLPCPPGGPNPCDTYQDFECGYIWRNGTSVLTTATCPGLYSISTASGGLHRHLEYTSGGWVSEGDITPPASSLDLKMFDERMVYKEGGGVVSFRVTTDGGETWDPTPKPELQSDGNHYHPVDADLCPDGRLWLAWQRYSGGGTLNRVRIYYSDDFGATLTQSVDSSIGGIGGGAAHSNGSVSCHPTDPNKIAVIVQRGSSARVRVTTDGGANWVTRSVGSLANSYRMVWSGDRLVVIADISSTVRIYLSEDKGASWSSVSFLQVGTNRSSDVEVIRTLEPGLLFAYAYDPGSTQYLLRSTDNGTSGCKSVHMAAAPRLEASPTTLKAGNCTTGPRTERCATSRLPPAATGKGQSAQTG